MNTIELSIVIPVYNESQNISELLARTHSLMAKLNISSFEVLFSDDGSTDDTLDILKKYQSSQASIKIVSLSRNFGQQQAITAGLMRSRGKAIVVMDADLQDPPELIEAMLLKWREGFHVVQAVRSSRSEKWTRRLATSIFYKCLRWVSGLNLGLDSGVFSLMDRSVLDAILKCEERNRYFPGIRTWAGFKQTLVFYKRDERHKGSPKQSLTRLFSYAADAIFGFSYKPLRIASLMGGLVFVGASAYAFILIVARIFHINVVLGFTTTAVATLLIGGLNLLCIGIVGEYIARIYEEVKRRPFYIEKEFISND